MMRIGVVGINTKSSELGIREQVAKACQRIFHIDCDYPFHAILLSTCNRTEIYFSAEDLTEAHSDILYLLRQEILAPFEHKLYSYFGTDCFMHLARVTAGLDSVILAESEIQRQVKVAYEQASHCQELPSSLHFLFQKCLKIGKQVRSSFFNARGLPSLEGTVYQLSNDLQPKIQDSSVLFIGNSQINRRILTHFKQKGVKKISLCTRAVFAAEELVKDEKVEVVDWSGLSSWIEYDLLICGTNHFDYLIKRPEGKVKTRLIFDLSVPRNVDPFLSFHTDLLLLNMEALGTLVEHKRQSYFSEIKESEWMIQEAVERQCALFDDKKRRMALCAC